MGKRASGWAVAIVATGALALGGPAVAQEPIVGIGPPPLPAGVVADGVSVAGVAVGGLSQEAAAAAITAQHVVPRQQSLRLTFRGRRLVLDPVRAGYSADVGYALRAAMLFGRSRPVPAGGVAIPLRETVDRARLRSILRQRARDHDLAVRNATLRFRGAKPVITKPRVGVVVDVERSMRVVEAAIIARDRPAYALVTRRVVPAVRSIGPVIVIERDRFRLSVWRAGRATVFPVAVGQPAYPTPAGLFSVITKQRNPTWFPPDSPWAEGLGPVPPGVSNPLGTRWIGTSAPAIGVHGTPQPGSIGTRASHGCVRMYIRDVERVYDMVEVGTPVLIR